MLVLSRKKDESIRIGDDIIIRVIAVKGGGVRLGFDAPIDVPIIRSELIPGHEGRDRSNPGRLLNVDTPPETPSFAEGI